MKVRRWVVAALLGSAMVVPSCSAERWTAPAATDVDASVPLASAHVLPESPAAAARIAELRARFRLPVHALQNDRPGGLRPALPEHAASSTRPALDAPVATRFASAGPDAATHVRAGLPSEALRGVIRPARVALPLRATGEVKLEDERSHLSVSFTLEHAQDARVEVAGGMALYRGTLDGADVVHRVHAEGTEDFVVFEQRPAREELRYSVDVSRAAGLRLVSDTLEFLDDTGTPRLRVAPPYVVDSKGQRRPAKLSVAGCSYDANPAGPWGRKVTVSGAARCTVRVAWGGGLAYPAMVDPGWTATGNMAVQRSEHRASVLPSGKVLIAGGYRIGIPLSSAELYDPAAGTFAATGSMTTGRYRHTASVLPSSKILVAGGRGLTLMLSSAELYDPAAGTFTATGSMATPRGSHTASMLSSGKVLVMGGTSNAAYLSSAELYDSGANTFADTGNMLTERSQHTSSVLPSGKILVVGGTKSGVAIANAELYDAGAGTFASTSPMANERYNHTASELPSGKVLVVGGHNSLTGSASAELYDPVANGGAGAFSTTGSLTTLRYNHTASVLPSGKVLVVGGYGGFGYLASAELYDDGTSTVTANLMVTGRRSHTASVLPSGKVLVAGGHDGGSLSSAELFGGVSGDPCTTNAYCLSGFCADGFCCDSPCTGGGCDRCDLPGKIGTCSVAPAGNPGANPSCAPSTCDGVKAACPSSCTSDATCAAEYYCASDGTCQPGKKQAAVCNPQVNCKQPGCRECQSGFCADGFCCDTACNGTCQACAAALKQSGVDGTCSPTKDGTDPRNQCEPSAVLCGPDGMCNGTGACRLVTPAGVSCAPGKACDGRGKCDLPVTATCDGDHTTMNADGKKQDCAPYRCDSNGTCRDTCTSGAECIAPAICGAGGKCVPPPSDAGGGDGCSVSTSSPFHPAPGSRALPLALLCTLAALARCRRERASRPLSLPLVVVASLALACSSSPTTAPSVPTYVRRSTPPRLM